MQQNNLFWGRYVLNYYFYLLRLKSIRPVEHLIVIDVCSLKALTSALILQKYSVKVKLMQLLKLIL